MSPNRNLESLYQQATTAYANGQFDIAENLARHLIAQEPRHANAYYLAGAIRLDTGDAASALPFLNTAAQLDPDHPGIKYALGNAHYILENWSEAIQLYNQLLKTGHADTQILLNLSTALNKTHQNEIALQILRDAVHAFPSDPALWNAYGDILNKENDDLASIEAHQKAVALAPDNADYSANLALMYEQSNRIEDAEHVAADKLKAHANHPLLLLICARCARRRKDYAEALSLLQKIPDDAQPQFKRAKLFEAGRVHDYRKESEEAYRCFVEGNRLTLEIWPSHTQEAMQFVKDWEQIRSYMNSKETLAWPSYPADAGQPRHVFLLGFMRSGTTLMDTILETDARITVLEEELPIHNIVRAAQALPGGYPKCLETIRPEQVDELRSQYWQEVVELTGPLDDEAVILDKQPMLGPHAGLLQLLFPNARFLFALRHPCDVVLSNFMQAFGKNPFHANFVTLEQAAAVYALVMGLWLEYRKLLKLNVHTLRYEDLINDKQRILSEVFGFLGLNEAQTDVDHVAHAKKRGRIYTPSYHQVVQPLYTDAMERWRRYRSYFEPVLPVLQPFIEQFGYTV